MSLWIRLCNHTYIHTYILQCEHMHVIVACCRLVRYIPGTCDWNCSPALKNLMPKEGYKRCGDAVLVASVLLKLAA